MEAIVWTLCILLIIVGLAGTVVPAVPGAPIILVAAVLHRLFLPQYLSWWTIAGLAVLAAAATVVDMACTLGGAKRMGATAWGLSGAGLGGLAGLLGGILGVLAGAILGAILGELIGSRRTFAGAVRAGLGAGLGLIASTAGRVLLGLAMVALFAADCIW
ncbi:MAG: DUF456 family protein [Elusimicrobiota bacterium]